MIFFIANRRCLILLNNICVWPKKILHGSVITSVCGLILLLLIAFAQEATSVESSSCKRRKLAASVGDSQSDSKHKFVGFASQSNRWFVVCFSFLQFGNRSESSTPIIPPFRGGPNTKDAPACKWKFSGQTLDNHPSFEKKRDLNCVVLSLSVEMIWLLSGRSGLEELSNVIVLLF